MDNWTVQRVSGGSLINVTPLVDYSSKYILIATGSSVRIFSTQTGERVGGLVGHTKSVTCIMSNPINPAQIYTCSLDGSIRLWSLIDSTCVKVWNIENNHPILGLALDCNDSSMAYIVIELTNNVSSSQSTASSGGGGGGLNNGNKKWRLIEFNLTTSRRGRTLVKGGGLFKVIASRSIISKESSELGSSKNGSYVAVLNGKEFIVWNSEKQFLYKWSHKDELTSLAIHPTDDFIATGDIKGRLIIWYCLNGSGIPSRKSLHASSNNEVIIGQEESIHGGSSDKNLLRKLKVSTSTHHWHAHALVSICFSSGEGEVLLTGGEEAVLVLWHLNSGTKSFLPRRGGPINKITVSPNGDSYALALETNTIQYVQTSTLKVSWSIHGLGLAAENSKNHLRKAIEAGIKRDPFSGNLVDRKSVV